MKMKKTIAILSVVLALMACTNELFSPEDPSSESISDLVFNFTVRYPGETKAVKSGWENGDKVFVFFKGVTTGYLTLSYDGSWTPAFAGTATVNDLTESGSNFVAVYLPYGNDATATYNSGWTFTAGKTDSYYLSANGSYTVTKADGITTLSADFNMVVPRGYVQFFIPDNDATGVISMACNAVSPAGVASISSDGVITETAATQGAFMTGYAATVNSEKGFYFSGKLAENPGNEYYFAIEMGSNHYDFYKHLKTPLAERAAIKLSTKHQVGPGRYVTIGSTSWCTVNHTAEVPWTYTVTKYTGWVCTDPTKWAEMGLSSGESIPDLDQMRELKTNTNEHRFGMSIAGVNGVLWVSASDESKYLFFPCESATNYFWSRTKYNDSNGGYTRFYYPSGGVEVVDSGGLSTSWSVRTVLASNVQYMEMGDGLKWATCNVGADTPQDYGDYFAWGETETYYSSLSPLTWKEGKTAGYAWGSYSLGNGSTFSKYNGTDYTTLQPEDDAASVNMGGMWRTPTKEEWLALRNTSNFTWTWETNYNGSGRKGYLVTSKVTGYAGNSIFLPAGGYLYDKTNNRIGEGLFYWGASINPSNKNSAYGFDCETGGYHNDYDERRYGQLVRAVCE
jgi:hypothetical protein